MGQTPHFTTRTFCAACRAAFPALAAVLGLLLIPAVAALAATVVAQADAASGVWRLTDEQGRVSFTDQPSAEAIRSGRAQRLDLPAISPQEAQRDEQARRQSEQEIARFNQQLALRLQRRAEAARATDLARQQLAEAQAVLQNGEEPEPGERSATRWGSRLNERYEQRRQQEQRQVEAAQQALDKAVAAEAALP